MQMPSFLSGIGDAMRSPKGQAINDLVGRGANVMSQAGRTSPDPATMGYKPTGGLGDIRTDMSALGGAPVLSNSNARFVPGGGRMPGLAPGTPAQGGAPPMNPGGYPQGSMGPF